MKRYLWLLFALGMPLSSPLACGGDGCLRHSDCASGLVCRQGECQPEYDPAGEGGASDEPSATSGSVSGGTSGKAGTSGSGGGGSGGKSGGASTGGGGANASGGTPSGSGGDAGERSAGGSGDIVAGSGAAGEPTL